MMHSYGKPHKVGDKGWRFEITFTMSGRKRMTAGWALDIMSADRLAEATRLAPWASDVKIEDRNLRGPGWRNRL